MSDILRELNDNRQEQGKEPIPQSTSWVDFRIQNLYFQGAYLYGWRECLELAAIFWTAYALE